MNTIPPELYFDLMVNQSNYSFRIAAFISFFILFCGCSDSQSQFYSLNDFKNIEKIDTHVHINTNHPALPEEAKVNNFRLLTVNVGSPSYPPISEQQEIARNLKESFIDQLNYLTTIPMEEWNNPTDWQNNAIAYLDESFQNGAIGVKVWKNIGMEFKNDEGEFVMIDNPQFDPVLNHIQEQGKPLLGHIGEPYSCWQPLEEMEVRFIRNYYENHPQYHMYLHPDNPSYEEIIASRDNMLNNHPELNFIGAHLGSMSWSIEMMSEHLDRYPNMVFDMAHRITLLQHLTQKNRDDVRNFFIKYQDRFVYSTDLQHHADSDPDAVRNLANNTWRQDWEFFVTDNEMVNTEVNNTPFRGLKLPKEVIDKVYRLNAEKTYPGI